MKKVKIIFTIVLIFSLVNMGINKCYAAFPIKMNNTIGNSVMPTSMQNDDDDDMSYISDRGHGHVSGVGHHVNYHHTAYRPNINYYSGAYRMHHHEHFRFYHGMRIHDVNYYERRGMWLSISGIFFFWTGVPSLLGFYYGWTSLRSEEKKGMAIFSLILCLLELVALGVIIYMFLPIL